MAQLNYYVKNKESAKLSTIYLSFTYDGYRYQTSTGLRVAPKCWDSKKGQLKQQYSHLDFYDSITGLLDDMKRKVIKEYYSKLNDGFGITLDEVKNIIQKTKYRSNTSKPTNNFFNIFDEFVEDRFIHLGTRTLQKFGTLRNRLKQYEEIRLEKWP